MVINRLLTGMILQVGGLQIWFWMGNLKGDHLVKDLLQCAQMAFPSWLSHNMSSLFDT